MPAPIGGVVALCVHSAGREPTVLPKAKVLGNFSMVKYTRNSNIITGKVTALFDSYRICHGGIKVTLGAYLELFDENAADTDFRWERLFLYANIFEGCPVATVISEGGDLIRGRKILNFNLTIPPYKSHPPAFEITNASLQYKLRAFIKRDDCWEEFASKLVNFKGYYHVPVELNPFVKSKVLRTNVGEIISTFKVPSTVAIMGQSDGLQAILELEGVLELENQVNATLTFYRDISYAKSNISEKNIRTELILSQNGQAEIYQSDAIFKWTIAVPMMNRISYTDALVPEYSVRYYLKYEVFLGLNVEAAFGDTAEVIIGTSRDYCGTKKDDSTSGASNQHIAETHSKGRRDSVTSLMSMLSLPSSFSLFSSRSGSMRSLQTSECAGTSGATDQSNGQTSRRRSVASFLSMLSLPPAYSQLSSRSGSVRSMETLPPKYDELKKEHEKE